MRSDYRTIKVELNQGVAILRLNNPPVNQLSKPFVEEMKDALMAVFEDHELKAAILTGTEKNFIAGADITEIQQFKEKNAILPFVMENNQLLEQFHRTGAQTCDCGPQWKLPRRRTGDRHVLPLPNCGKGNPVRTARGSDRFDPGSRWNAEASPTGGASRCFEDDGSRPAYHGRGGIGEGMYR